jgi:hypothetical protein
MKKQTNADEKAEEKRKLEAAETAERAGGARR